MATRKRARGSEFSNPFLVQEVRFNSSPAQSVFKVGYGDCDIALRGIGAALPVIIRNDSEIAVINGAVEHLMNNAFTEIRTEVARIKKIAEDNGIELGKVSYTSALSFEVQITSSKSGQYLQMIRELDNLIGLLHAAWLAGFISDEQKAKMERQWRKKVLSVSTGIKGISTRAFRAAQNAKDSDTDEDEGDGQDGDSEDAVAAKPVKAKKPAKKSGAVKTDKVDAPVVTAATAEQASSSGDQAVVEEAAA